jgi:glutathione S-transferase
MIDRQMANRTWAIGADFSIADCAAFPGLFYATTLEAFADTHPNAIAYFKRLVQRLSIMRVIQEARPYFQFYPFQDTIPQRFR